MKKWNNIISMALISLIITQGLVHSQYTLLSNNDNKKTCGEGTYEYNNTCIAVRANETSPVVEVLLIDFLKDSFVVKKGDLVRLVFDVRIYNHYVPDTFSIPSLGIEVDLQGKSFYVFEFEATEEGTFEYSSKGMCRVKIPGAGEVEVDCAIYCGEVNNGRVGAITVEPAEEINAFKVADIGFETCSLLGTYCDGDRHYHD